MALFYDILYVLGRFQRPFCFASSGGYHQGDIVSGELNPAAPPSGELSCRRQD